MYRKMSKLEHAPTGYTFDDFIIVPQHSEVPSRKSPDLSVDVPGFQYKLPIVSSPMNTVTELEMIVTMHSLGGVGVLHRYMDVEDQLRISEEAQTRLRDAGADDSHWLDNPPFYVAVGANGDSLDRVKVLRNAGVTGFCVDVANGHNELSVQAVRAIRRLVPDARIMAGNVCTFNGAHALAKAGANSIRVGIGPGSMCTTRQVTGHGLPQLSAIEDCVRIKWKGNGFSDNSLVPSSYHDVAIIADGGIRRSADIIKALAIGADAVMLGSLLAGTYEAPGEYIEDEDGKVWKYYHGMASEEGRAQYSGQNTGVPAEGVSTKILYTGKKASKVIENLTAATKVGLSFSGAYTIRELQQKAQWCRVSQAGYVEGTPHGK